MDYETAKKMQEELETFFRNNDININKSTNLKKKTDSNIQSNSDDHYIQTTTESVNNTTDQKNKSEKTETNFISNALSILGIGIILVGTIGSLCMGKDEDVGGIWILVGILSSIISGILMMGFAEIIKIADDNRKLLTFILQKIDTTLLE